MTTENGLIITPVTGGETRSYVTNPNEWMGNVHAETDPVTGGISYLTAGSSKIRVAGQKACGTGWPMGVMGTASLGGNCHQESIVVPFDYDAVEIAILHTGASAGGQHQMIVSSSETLAALTNDPVMFGQTVGATMTAPNYPGWQKVTWSGTWNSPVIAAPGAGVIGYTAWSDAISVPSVKRTDSGVGRVFMMRDYLTGATQSRFTASPSTEYTAWTEVLALAQGCEYAFSVAYLKAGDYVTNPSGFTGATPARTSTVPGHVKRFLCNGNYVPSVMFVGDSRMSTNGATVTTLNSGYNEHSSVPHKCITQMARRGLPFAMQQCGWSGGTSAQYSGAALTMIPALAPTFVAYMLHTVNDTAGDDFDSAIIDAQLATAATVKTATEAAGGIFIPVCAFPYGSALSAGQLIQRARLVSYASSCGAYVDPAALMGQAGGTWRSDVPNDGTHGATLARDIVAAEIARAIQYDLR